jgi:pimeloyl-ACP methyl ester carboxylesterase
MAGLNDFSNITRTRKKNKRNFWYILVKVMLIFLGVTVLINILLFSISALNHKSKLNKEAPYLIEPGTMVNVDGENMHVYITGNQDADTTLLFMHNNQDSDACIELKPLFSYLEADYKLVYVDRLGNGYSDDTEKSRDIDTMLEDTRKALSRAGVTESLTLVPNGTAGLEAVYWAEKYPEEVDSIIGISMAYPAQVAADSLDAGYERFGKTLKFFAKIGGHRFLSNTYPENDEGLYSEKDMLVRNALISRQYYTNAMYNEDISYYDNGRIVNDYGEFPQDIPILMIFSNPLLDPYYSSNETIQNSYASAIEDYGDDIDLSGVYNSENMEYFESYDNVTCVEMSGPITLFEYDPAGVADYIESFLNGDALE